MAKENEKNLNKGTQSTTDQNQNPPKSDTDGDQKDEEQKKEDKEFFLIRWGKGLWNGCKKAGKAVNTFAHEHPYITAGITAGAGYAAKIAVDHFSTDDVPCASEPIALPEAEDYQEPEYEIEFNDEPEEISEPDEVKIDE